MAAKPKPKRTNAKTAQVGDKPKVEVVETKPRLTPKQELFCQYYTSASEFFGNGVQSYLLAYGFDGSNPRDIRTASSNASRMLRNADILERINELLNDLVMNDQHVDKQLGFLISQNDELNTKLGAIKEYNALKQRVKQKIDAELSGELTIAVVKYVGDDPKAG